MSNYIQDFSEKSTIVDNDLTIIADSAATNQNKKVKASSIWNYIKGKCTGHNSGINADKVDGIEGANLEWKQSYNTSRHNLGDPTVRDMALFKSTFTNKFQFVVPQLMEAYTNNTWETYTGQPATSLDVRKVFVGNGTMGNLYITREMKKLRLTFEEGGYRSLDHLYMYTSTQAQTMSVMIEKYNTSAGQWVTVANPETFHQTWPGHISMPHNSIWYRGESGKVRITLTGNFITNTQDPYYNTAIYIYSLEWFGGYPAGNRDPYIVDVDNRFYVPTSLKTMGSSNQPVIRTVATTSGTEKSGSSIAIQEETAEGNTIIFADYSPFENYALIHNNSADTFDITAGFAGTSDIDAYNITGSDGVVKGAYVKARLGQGDGNITASNKLVSLTPQGTSPLSVVSTTVVPNLNVDFVDGYHATTANTASNIAVRDSNSNINATSFTGLLKGGIDKGSLLEKTTLVDNDVIYLADSASSNTTKYQSVSNLKIAIRDALYLPGNSSSRTFLTNLNYTIASSTNKMIGADSTIYLTIGNLQKMTIKITRGTDVLIPVISITNNWYANSTPTIDYVRIRQNSTTATTWYVQVHFATQTTTTADITIINNGSDKLLPVGLVYDADSGELVRINTSSRYGINTSINYPLFSEGIQVSNIQHGHYFNNTTYIGNNEGYQYYVDGPNFTIMNLMQYDGNTPSMTDAQSYIASNISLAPFDSPTSNNGCCNLDNNYANMLLWVGVLNESYGSKQLVVGDRNRIGSSDSLRSEEVVIVGYGNNLAKVNKMVVVGENNNITSDSAKSIISGTSIQHLGAVNSIAFGKKTRVNNNNELAFATHNGEYYANCQQFHAVFRCESVLSPSNTQPIELASDDFVDLYTKLLSTDSIASLNIKALIRVFDAANGRIVESCTFENNLILDNMVGECQSSSANIMACLPAYNYGYSIADCSTYDIGFNSNNNIVIKLKLDGVQSWIWNKFNEQLSYAQNIKLMGSFWIELQEFEDNELYERNYKK